MYLIKVTQEEVRGTWRFHFLVYDDGIQGRRLALGGGYVRRLILSCMKLNTERDQGVLIAAVTGRIDGFNAPEFEHAVQGAIGDEDRAVVLDLEHLSYISSAGLRVILMTAKGLQQAGGQLMLCTLSPPVREVFEISGFDQIILFHPSRAEAVAAHNG